jgi:hypothetical protein
MAGLALRGWRLTYGTDPTKTRWQEEAEGGEFDPLLLHRRDISRARARHVAWEGPTFNAGFAPAMRITRIDDEPFSRAALLKAVPQTPHTLVVLTIGVGTALKRLLIEYRGGARHPRLSRVSGTQDRRSPLLASR